MRRVGSWSPAAAPAVDVARCESKTLLSDRWNPSHDMGSSLHGVEAVAMNHCQSRPGVFPVHRPCLML